MRGYPPRWETEGRDHPKRWGLSPQGGSRPSGRIPSCCPRSEAISVILKWPLSKSALAQQLGRKLAHRLRRGLRALEREKVPALDALDVHSPARMRQAHPAQFVRGAPVDEAGRQLEAIAIVDQVVREAAVDAVLDFRVEQQPHPAALDDGAQRGVIAQAVGIEMAEDLPAPEMRDHVLHPRR